MHVSTQGSSSNPCLHYSNSDELRQLNGPMDGVLHIEVLHIKFRLIRVERQHSGGVFRRGDKEGLPETCIQLHLRFGTCPVEDTRTVEDKDGAKNHQRTNALAY